MESLTIAISLLPDGKISGYGGWHTDEDGNRYQIRWTLGVGQGWGDQLSYEQLRAAAEAGQCLRVSGEQAEIIEAWRRWPRLAD